MFYAVINKQNIYIYIFSTVILMYILYYIEEIKARKKKDIYYLIYQKLFDSYTFYVFKNVILRYVNYNLFNKKGLI